MVKRPGKGARDLRFHTPMGRVRRDSTGRYTPKSKKIIFRCSSTALLLTQHGGVFPPATLSATMLAWTHRYGWGRCLA